MGSNPAIVEKPTIYVPQPVSDKEGKSGYVYLVTSFAVANITDEETRKALEDIEKNIIGTREYQKKTLLEDIAKKENLQFKEFEVWKEKRGGYLYLFYDNFANPGVAGEISCYVYKEGDPENWFAVCTAAYSCDKKKYGDKCIDIAIRFAGAAYHIEGIRKKWELEGKKAGKL